MGEYFELNKIDTNDIHLFSKKYGIEAGRNALVKEIFRVFNHYGIKIDYRHMYLISDYMTFYGFLNPLSR